MWWCLTKQKNNQFNEITMSTESNKTEQESVIAQQGTFTLLDNTTLKGYPKPASQNEDISSPDFELDTTGQYLQMGHRSRKAKRQNAPQIIHPTPAEEYFYKHALLFIRHREQILSDSRLFLTPVDVTNNLAYTGTSGFRNATLGVYVEWWLYGPASVIVDEETNMLQGMVCRIAGSPLTGINKCTVVMCDGTIQEQSIQPFLPLWTSFTEINGRYTEAKRQFEHYTIEEAVRVLSSGKE
mgnify:CR=1 FL=1